MYKTSCKYYCYVQGPFAKFKDSPYYSKSELCGGVVTVSFSKYLPWQAMHFLQHSTHFSKTCYRPLITLKFLASELPFMVGKAQMWQDVASSGLYGRCSNGVPPIHFFQLNTEFNSDLTPHNFWAFPTMQRKLQGKKFRKLSTVCSTFPRSRWSIVRSAPLAKGGTSKKRL
jgi:hypothetical protein